MQWIINSYEIKSYVKPLGFYSFKKFFVFMISERFNWNKA